MRGGQVTRRRATCHTQQQRNCENSLFPFSWTSLHHPGWLSEARRNASPRILAEFCYFESSKHASRSSDRRDLSRVNTRASCVPRSRENEKKPSRRGKNSPCTKQVTLCYGESWASQDIAYPADWSCSNQFYEFALEFFTRCS